MDIPASSAQNPAPKSRNTLVLKVLVVVNILQRVEPALDRGNQFQINTDMARSLTTNDAQKTASPTGVFDICECQYILTMLRDDPR
jgi:hypothetical protein